MSILLVTNGNQRCGVAQWGRRMLKAAYIAGWDITLWNADYPTYLPEDLSLWDLVFFNWHGGTIGHVLPEHVKHPASTKLAGFFHEVTPERIRNGEVPELWKIMDLRFTAEGGDGAVAFPPPGPEAGEPVPLATDVTIGNSGLRGDGLDWIQPICAARGWNLAPSQEWLPDHTEVGRLAACTLNVAHYHSGNLGQSAAVMTMVAARRPILVNSNPMLKWIGQWAEPHRRTVIGRLDIPAQVYLDDDFEHGVDTILRDIAEGQARRPLWLAGYYSWSTRIRVLGTLLETLR